MRRTLFLLVLISFIQLAAAKDLSLDSYVDKTRIGLSEYVRFSLEFSGDDASKVKTPQLGNIKNFKNSGSSSSSSTNMTIVNGKMERSVTKTFTYNLRPLRTGTLLIPPITIKVDKQNFTTDPVSITVTKNTPAPSTNADPSTPDNSQKLSDNLFLVAEVNKKTVYKDEPVIVDYVLYTRYEISNLSFANEPVFNGFWKENVFMADRIEFKRTTYQNVSFNSMLMRTIALYPSKSGTLEIPSQEILVDIRTKPASFFDMGQTKRYEIKSDPVNIQVKELPLTGRPADYAGAVGNFTLRSDISTDNMKVGESLTYTLEINGSGNLNHFDPPVLPEIQNFRFIDPEISTEINQDQLSGKKVIKYLVIAQEKGTFTIPALSFSYFDANTGRYVTRKTKSYTISVSEGDQIYIPSSSAQALVTLEGSDIGFIIREPDLSTSSLYFDSFFYWLLIFFLFLALPFSSIYYRNHEKLYSDKDYVRQKQADKILKKYLKEAQRKFNLKDPGFYSDVHTGLSNYLTDKIKINRGSSTNDILNILQPLIQEELLHKVEAIFARCDEARFMPGGFSDENLINDFNLLKKTLTELARIKF